MEYEKVYHYPMLQTVQTIAEFVNHSYAPEVAIVKILQLLATRLKTTCPCIFIRDEQQSLRLAHSYGLSIADCYTLTEFINNQSASWYVQSTVQSAEDDSTHSLLQYFSNKPFNHCILLGDYCVVPILQNGTPRGVLLISAPGDYQEHKHQISTLLCIAASFINKLLHINELLKLNPQICVTDNFQINELPRNKQSFGYGIVGNSNALRHAVNTALRAADSKAAVMLIGESGTGKEKFARMIHEASARRNKPFIAFNCAALPENLMESELFGHEKGSFTGATNTRKGKFELANGGTLFLDEIGDMSADLQSKLLRVLQENALQRVGGSSEIHVDVRILTATHKDLQNAVNSSHFRLDLFYRLNVIRVNLPPLRDRKGDLRLLAEHFWILETKKHDYEVALSQEAVAKLERYDWPGNVRQLQNVIERAVIMAEGNIVTAQDIETILADESKIDLNQHNLAHSNNHADNAKKYNGASRINEIEGGDMFHVRPYYRVRNEERETIKQALRWSKGNKTYAAKKLGLTPRQLHYRMTKLNIDNCY